LNDTIKELVSYRLKRSNESLDEASMLFDQGHINTYINRLYYACFYSVSALLISKGLHSSKHAGIRSIFHQNFIKTGIIQIRYGLLYDRFFDNRQKADYSDFVNFDPLEVRDWLNDADDFVKTISEYISSI